MDGDGTAPVLFTNPDGEWQVPQAHPSPHCPSQSPTPPLNWAVALSIHCFTYGFSPVAAKTHGPLGAMSHSGPGTYEADSLKTQDSPQSFP